MKKLISLIFTMAILFAVSAQDVTVYSISEIDPNKEFESYAFLSDMDQQFMDQTREKEMDQTRRSDKQETYSQQGDVDQQDIREEDRRTGDYSTQQSTTDYDQRSTVRNSGQNGWAKLNPMENSIIKEAIDYEFDVQGLTRTQDNPDMYVQYHIYNQDYAEDGNYIRASEDYEYTYPKKRDLVSNIEDGTVIMSIVDADEGVSVWEGFAYNSFDKNASLDEKQQGLRQAVDALVTQFLADNANLTGAGDVTR